MWIFKLFRNVRKSPNLIRKHRKQYKDAKIAKILEETIRRKRKSHEAENTKFG